MSEVYVSNVAAAGTGVGVGVWAASVTSSSKYIVDDG